jgi:hypothetical protein
MDELITALEATEYPFAHFAWARAPDGTYGTYSEDGLNRLAGDNRSAEKALIVYVALFTRDDSETPRETVEAALDGIPCAWYLNTVQYEEDTRLIHYEWVCEV